MDKAWWWIFKHIKNWGYPIRPSFCLNPLWIQSSSHVVPRGCSRSAWLSEASCGAGTWAKAQHWRSSCNLPPALSRAFEARPKDLDILICWKPVGSCLANRLIGPFKITSSVRRNFCASGTMASHVCCKIYRLTCCQGAKDAWDLDMDGSAIWIGRAINVFSGSPPKWQSKIIKVDLGKPERNWARTKIYNLYKFSRHIFWLSQQRGGAPQRTLPRSLVLRFVALHG